MEIATGYTVGRFNNGVGQAEVAAISEGLSGKLINFSHKAIRYLVSLIPGQRSSQAGKGLQCDSFCQVFELSEILPIISTSASNSKDFQRVGVGCGMFAPVVGKIPQIVAIYVDLIIKSVNYSGDTDIIIIPVFALKFNPFPRFPKGPPITRRGQIDFFRSKKHNSKF